MREWGMHQLHACLFIPQDKDSKFQCKLHQRETPTMSGVNELELLRA